MELQTERELDIEGSCVLNFFPVEFTELIRISEACAASARKKKDQASLFSVLFFWAGWLIHASFEIKMHTRITRDFFHSWRKDLCGRLYTSSVVAYDESLDVWGCISFRTMNSSHWDFWGKIDLDCISGTWIAFLADLSVNHNQGMSERSVTNVFVSLWVCNKRKRLDLGVWYAEVLKGHYTPLSHMMEVQ